MTTNNVQVPIKKSHKRTKPSSSRNYGGWSTSDHLTFIESFSGLLTIEFRVYDRRWKLIQTCLTSKTPNQIRTHALSFFKSLSKYCPRKIRMFEFVGSKSMEFLSNISFDSSEDENPIIPLKEKITSSEKDLPSLKSKPEPEPKYFPNQTLHPVNNEQFQEEIKFIYNKTQPGKSTQLQVITANLHIIRKEMMKLMLKLTDDMGICKENQSTNENVSGYWDYIYSNSTYLQQLISDINIVHDRSEERRVGKECTCWCKSLWSLCYLPTL